MNFKAAEKPKTFDIVEVRKTLRNARVVTEPHPKFGSGRVPGISMVICEVHRDYEAIRLHQEKEAAAKVGNPFGM